jgi:hypothetical protein
MHVGSGNAGKFIAYLPDGHIAMVLDVVVQPDGTFVLNGTSLSVHAAHAEVVSTLSTQSDSRAHAVGGLTLSIQIINGAVSGQIPELGLTLTGAIEPASGPAQSIAGLYSATALNAASGSTYTIIGASGQAMILVVTPTIVDGGMASVNGSDQITATLSGATRLTISIEPSSGEVSCSVTPPGASVPIAMTGLLSSVSPVNRIVNLSTRGYVGTNDNVMIVGFVISGSGSKPILMRAVGPTLGLPPFKVGGVIADPLIVLKQQSNGVTLASNDNWSESADVALISDAFTQTGAFSIPGGSKDAALVANLPAGSYTAIVSGAGSTSGVAIAEVYSITDAATPGARLVNISTRGYVGTGDSIMIPGFITEGNAPRRLLVRGVGPTLGQPPFNVAGVLPDPILYVYLQGGSSPVATNDDWDVNGSGDEIASLSQQVYAFALPRGSKDAVLVITIPPNTGYTVLVSGNNGTTGVVIAEVYELP